MKMKHKKLTAVLVLVCFLLTLMPVMAMARTIDSTLPVPSALAWDTANEDAACVTWETTWEGMQRVRARAWGHDGIGTGIRYESVINNDGTCSFPIANMIKDAGTIEVEVFAGTNDGVDGNVATITKDFPLAGAIPLDAPKNLTWKDGFASWDPVTGADGYTVLYYENGKPNEIIDFQMLTAPGVYNRAIPCAVEMDGKVVDRTNNFQRSNIDLGQNGEYVFSVFAVSYQQKTESNSTVTTGTDVLKAAALCKLGPVTGLQWVNGMPGDIEFYPVVMANNGYHVDLYRNGEMCGWGTHNYGYDGKTGKANIPLSKLITESGTYTFNIYAVGDGKYTTDGDSVAISTPFEYTKPTEMLRAPELVFWDYENGRACWNAVDGADNYMVYIQVDGDQVESFTVRADENVFYKDGVKCNYGNQGRVLPDVTKLHQEGNDITFMVRSQADDITRISSSLLSPTSPVFGNSQAVADKVNDDLTAQLLAAQAAVANGNTPKQLNVTDKTQMQQAMQDPAVMATLDEYETLYKDKVGVNVTTDTSGVADPSFDASKVQIQGATLNASTGGQLIFKISDATTGDLEYDGKKYTDNVQFLNLSLWRDDVTIGEGENNLLDVPVRVTLPVPSNITPDKLRILHYNGNGESEVITPTLNADKTLASFVLLHFSDFALVELKDTNNNSNIGGGSSSGGGGVYAGPSSTGAGVTKPATPALTMKMKVNDKVITANGKNFTYDVAPIIVGDRTMVPVRVIMETLGAKVEWNEASRTVTITLDGKVMTMVIDQEIPGYGTAPFIQNDRTYVPIRYIMEKAGADVKWIAETGEIVITK